MNYTGLSPDYERWTACSPGFFLPVPVLSRLFRRLFLEALEAAFQDKELKFFGELEPLAEASAFAAFLAPLCEAEWVVYAKPPFGGFQRIRHFGFLANCYRKVKLAICRKLLISPITDLLPQPAECRLLLESITELPVTRCPECGVGTMVRTAILPSYRWPAVPPDTS